VRRRRLLGACGALALLLAVIAFDGRSEPASQQLLVQGDSLAVGTRPFLRRELSDWKIRHSVKVGRHTARGVAWLHAHAASLPDVIHVSLGTNDDPRRVSAFRESIRAVMDLVGPSRCVVWANIVRSPAHGKSYSGYNRALAAESRPRDNMRVVNWARLVRDNPDWLAADGVHATAAGYEGRARLVARSVRRCQFSDGSAGMVASSR
jgi:hypothetical protein